MQEHRLHDAFQTKPPAGAPLLRVERGHAEPEELAALAVVLLARCADAGSGADATIRPIPARWCRPEWASGFEGPRTWRRAA